MSVLATFSTEGSWWYASCHDLDVHTQGRSRKEAHENLVEALQFFVISCIERGKIDQVLKNSGYVPDVGSAGPGDDENQTWLEVPLSLVAQNEQNRTNRMGSVS